MKLETIFPPEDRWGRPGFATLLKNIAKAWKEKRTEILEDASKLTEAIRDSDRPKQGELEEKLLTVALEMFKQGFDEQYAGFRARNKFPRSIVHELLLRIHRRTRDWKALQMVERTLVAMRNGGMFDPLGGGFHRYSTDERWLVPHFENISRSAVREEPWSFKWTPAEACDGAYFLWTRFRSRCANFSEDSNPTTRSSIFPSADKIHVSGIARLANHPAASFSLSTSNSTNTKCSSMIFFTRGSLNVFTDICLHAPHHSAVQSTSTSLPSAFARSSDCWMNGGIPPDGCVLVGVPWNCSAFANDGMYPRSLIALDAASVSALRPTTYVMRNRSRSTSASTFATPESPSRAFTTASGQDIQVLPPSAFIMPSTLTTTTSGSVAEA